MGLFFAALIAGVGTLPTKADPLKMVWASTGGNRFDVVFDATGNRKPWRRASTSWLMAAATDSSGFALPKPSPLSLRRMRESGQCWRKLCKMRRAEDAFAGVAPSTAAKR